MRSSATWVGVVGVTVLLVVPQGLPLHCASSFQGRSPGCLIGIGSWFEPLKRAGVAAMLSNCASGAPGHRAARRLPRDNRTSTAVPDDPSRRSPARLGDDPRGRTRPRSLRRHPDPPYGCHRLAGCSPLRRAEILAQGRSRHTMRGGRADRVGDWHPCVRGECLRSRSANGVGSCRDAHDLDQRRAPRASKPRLDSPGPLTPRRGEKRSQRSTPLQLPCPSPSDSTTCRLTTVDSTVKDPAALQRMWRVATHCSRLYAANEAGKRTVSAGDRAVPRAMPTVSRAGGQRAAGSLPGPVGALAAL
jgi:hypothetical protein